MSVGLGSSYPRDRGGRLLLACLPLSRKETSMSKIEDLEARRAELLARTKEIPDYHSEISEVQKGLKRLSEGLGDVDEREFFVSTQGTMADRTAIKEEMAGLEAKRSELEAVQAGADAERAQIERELADVHKAIIPLVHQRVREALDQADQVESKTRKALERLCADLVRVWEAEDTAIHELSEEVRAFLRTGALGLDYHSFQDSTFGEVIWKKLGQNRAFGTLNIGAIPGVLERQTALRGAIHRLREVLAA